MIEAREKEANFRTLMEAMPAAVFVHECGKFTYVNTAAEMMTGYTRRELSSIPPAELVHPQFRAMVHPMGGSSLQDGVSSSRSEIKIDTKNGENRWIDLTTVPAPFGGGTAVLWTAFDITERKQAEEAGLRLVTAVEQASEAVVICDIDGTIRYANPAFERITGYSRQEAVGRHSRLLKSGKHNRAFYEKMWNSLLRGEVWRGRFINQRKDGTLYEAEATISPIRDASGKLVNFFSVKRDVTHESEMEKQLLHTLKMEAIGTMAGGIAHDFNNILGAILGYTELALNELPADNPVRSHLRHVHKAGNRAKGIVQQILTFSRQGEYERKPVRIAPIMKNVLKSIRASLPSTIEIDQQIMMKPGRDIVLADPAQIRQLLMSLCTNAGHAMKEKGGVLTVKLRESELDEDFASHHPGVHSGSYVQLDVCDTGHGIDPSVVERIFDPFFTTKGPGEGSGMGLSVVHGIVRGHGGAIDVSSEPGRGTAFQILLPRIRQEAPRKNYRRTVKAFPSGRERILIVDDEELLVQIGQESLENLGYEVVGRTDSRGALEAFRAEPHRFDLVITDQTMPEMTGVELAREIKRIRSGIPIILWTGFSDLINQENAKSLGIQEFLMKPFTLRDLARSIRNAMNKS